MPDDLLSFVDTLIGSDSHHGFSTGNCVPLCAVPFGMTHWSPQTAEDRWFFDRRSRKLQGIRATHQPSPWIGEYGAFTVMPQTGELSVQAPKRASGYRLERSAVRPDYLRFELVRYGVRVEVAPTRRCAILRFTFPPDEPRRVILEPVAGDSYISVDPSCAIVVGNTKGATGGCPDNFACHYVIRFNEPVLACGTFIGADVRPGSRELEGHRAGAYIEFDPSGPAEIEMKIGTSFIDLDQAARNLNREIGNATFPEIRERANRVWNESLGRIEIEDDDLQAVKTFYTCLYRTHLFPRVWHEKDADGAVYHYSPFDGRLHEGPLYTDNGFWDTYRTMYPLLSLLLPERLAEILQGWTNAYKEGGWFPQWASPGYRACMVGTHIDAVMADAVAKGIVDFEVDTALEGLLKHAREPGDGAGSYGRLGIEDYLEIGYVAADKTEASVARTLDYAYDDWCIAQVLKARGRGNEAAEFLVRARNYEHCWDRTVGFMRGRNADGGWADFDRYCWGGPYVEGGPWQSNWAVPHDPHGLIQLMGGPERFVDRLEEMLAVPPEFSVGTYGFEIHEMTEMACANFGQYAHSNQPVHHVLYLFTLAGRPDLTQHWVRRVMDELYTSQHFPGDEDNGEMSAWFVLSALGFYPLCPGDPRYLLGIPRFRKAAVRPYGLPEFVIESSGSGLVKSVTVDGAPHDSPFIDHAVLAGGASIAFQLAPNEVAGDLEEGKCLHSSS
jgi:predicted alpha-1,2-mannosidase